jgi:hypothetical protein
MPSLSLDIGDAAELAEMLQFMNDWLRTDDGLLAASLARFIGSDAYHTGHLLDDLNRFIFLLGGSDGTPLFQPDRGMQCSRGRSCSLRATACPAGRGPLTSREVAARRAHDLPAPPPPDRL